VCRRCLAAVVAGQPPSEVPAFISTWQRDYDYLYVVGRHVANPLPDLLEELDRSARFVLYKVRRTR
jgi:hypothetical protein